MSEVIHNTAEHRYEIDLDGPEVFAAAYYQMDGNGDRVLVHTEVPEEYQGEGIATRLARYVFDDARKTGVKLIPACWFMAEYYARHPEYQDVVAS